MNRCGGHQGTGAGHFCFERVKAPWDVQVLRDVSRCNAWAQILEAVAGRLSVLAGQRVDLAGDGGVMAEHVARGRVGHIGMAHCAALIGFTHARTRCSGGPMARGWTASRMRTLCKDGRTTRKRQSHKQSEMRTFHGFLLCFVFWADGQGRVEYATLPSISSIAPRMP